jgi:predicted XRE-type DNA-binding protein
MIPTFVETSPGSNVWFGTGNVFYDLEFPDAHERTTKMRLTAAIRKILKARKLTRKRAAALLGIKPTELSDLQNFKIDEFPAERLLHFAGALDYDVVIELRPRVTSDGMDNVKVVVVEG